MDAAATLFGDPAPCGAVLLSTDADGRVAPEWLAANLAALAEGADAVAGAIEIDARGGEASAASLRAREAQRHGYGALLDEMAALVDPIPTTPGRATTSTRAPRSPSRSPPTGASADCPR